jgi:V-type H+-transporting ATPase 16kDa proteolipid subunit
MTASPELLTGLGAAASIFLTSAGAAVASVEAGKYAMRSSGIMSFAPIIISGVLAIYGIIVSALLAYKIRDSTDAVSGYKNLSAGLSVGLACLVSGMGMARFMKDSIDSSEEEATAASQQEPLIRSSMANKMLARPSIRFLMVMTFLEAIGLYGLIIALVLTA